MIFVGACNLNLSAKKNVNCLGNIFPFSFPKNRWNHRKKFTGQLSLVFLLFLPVRKITSHHKSGKLLTLTWIHICITLPETNFAPENWWLEDDLFPFGARHLFRCELLVSVSILFLAKFQYFTNLNFPETDGDFIEPNRYLLRSSVPNPGSQHGCTSPKNLSNYYLEDHPRLVSGW